MEALTRDRAQLLGEAATYEAAGESIVLDESLWDAARDAQERRRVTDPWEDILRLKLEAKVAIHKSGDGFERVASTMLVLHFVSDAERASD